MTSADLFDTLKRRENQFSPNPMLPYAQYLSTMSNTSCMHRPIAGFICNPDVAGSAVQGVCRGFTSRPAQALYIILRFDITFNFRMHPAFRLFTSNAHVVTRKYLVRRVRAMHEQCTNVIQFPSRWHRHCRILQSVVLCKSNEYFIGLSQK